MADDVVLHVNNLFKDFGSHQVIKSLSFNLQKGNRTAIYAPSGAGKTTLIKILAGLEPETSGKIQLNVPAPVTIFQEPRLFPYMTVEENILLPYKIRKTGFSKELFNQYHRWLKVCELIQWKDYYPCQLSGGMKQKVSLVRGLLGHPSFVMMDEPFQSIGATSKKAIIEHMKENYPELTIFFVTHNAEEVRMLAQSVLFFTTNYLSNPLHINAENFELFLSENYIPAQNLCIV